MNEDLIKILERQLEEKVVNLGPLTSQIREYMKDDLGTDLVGYVNFADTGIEEMPKHLEEKLWAIQSLICGIAEVERLRKDSEQLKAIKSTIRFVSESFRVMG